MSRVALCAFALFLASTSASLADPVFLTRADYDPALLLPPPPADDSPAAKTDLAELEQLQAGRTPAQYAHAKSDGEIENPTIFKIAIGDGFDLAALPATAKLLADVRSDEKDAVSVAKKYFRRNRPWVLDPGLQSCSRGDDPQSSYPSGHSTMGYSMAVVLASLMPEKAPAILARASDFAHSRLVCGVHYRSDIVAGEALGTAIAVMLLHNPQFKPEYDAAEAELKAAHLAQ